MKKILLAFDGRHFSQGVFDFARQLHAMRKVFVTGIFLPSIDYLELMYSYGGIPAGPLYVVESTDTDDELLRKNIARFSQLCEEAGIPHKVHTDFSGHIVNQVKNETRFADVLVLSSFSFYENLGRETQEDYIANVLHKSECPVVLVPEEYKVPDNIVMAYDGSEQSVFAIKQFAYLFPEYYDKKVLLAYFGKEQKDMPLPEEIEELVKLHFEYVEVSRLALDPKKEMEQWLEHHGDTMLVAGAYGRSLLSELFKKSFITDVIRKHKAPIFVAHK